LRSGVRRSKWSTGPFRWPDGQPLLTLPESPAFAREACEGASTVARRAKVDLVAASFGWRAVTILLNQWASSFWNRLAMSRVGPPRGARPSTGDTLQQRSAPFGCGPFCYDASAVRRPTELRNRTRTDRHKHNPFHAIDRRLDRRRSLSRLEWRSFTLTGLTICKEKLQLELQEFLYC